MFCGTVSIEVDIGPSNIDWNWSVPGEAVVGRGATAAVTWRDTGCGELTPRAGGLQAMCLGDSRGLLFQVLLVPVPGRKE